MGSRLIEGEGLRVGAREVVPIVRVTTRRALPRARRFGAGGGWVTVRPLALIERLGGQERRIQIRDVTTAAIRALAISAVLVWGVLWTIRKGARYVH